MATSKSSKSKKPAAAPKVAPRKRSAEEVLACLWLAGAAATLFAAAASISVDVYQKVSRRDDA